MYKLSMISNNKHFTSAKQSRHSVSGFTLVELLVGIGLSLFIATMALTYLVSSSRTFNVNASETYINDNYRFTSSLLAQGLRRAGANSTGIITAANPEYFFLQALCPGPLVDVPCTRSNGGVNGSDDFAVRYVLPNTNTCNGTPTDTFLVPSNDDYVVDHYTVGRDGNGIPTLFCQTYLHNDTTNAWVVIGLNVPLISGVEMLQVRFGVDTDADLAIDQYANIAAMNVGNWWSGIKSVQIGLLISTGQTNMQVNNAEDVGTEDIARVYNVLGAASPVYNDRLTRKTFTTTVLVPNLRDI